MNVTIEQWDAIHAEIITLKQALKNLHVSVAGMNPRILTATGDEVEKAQAIQQFVAAKFNMSVKMLLAHKRPEKIAWPRQIAMYLCRECTGLTLQDIGRLFGGKDHGTILHAVKTVESRCYTEDDIKILVEELKAICGADEMANNL